MKPALWLIAGWSFPAAALAPLARALTEVFTPRLLGLHEPPLDDGAEAGEALAHLAHAEGPPAALFGWSAGGGIALCAAARMAAPPRLALLASTARFCAGPDRGFGMPRAELRALRAGLRRDPARALAGFDVLCGAPGDDDRAAFRDGPPADALLRGLDELDRLDARPALRGLPRGLLWLHGADDRVIPPAAAETDARDGDTVIILPARSHRLPIEAPDECAAHLRAWWNPA
jgi:pimeloyl-[acyl-carrier protein] methyl ester esterase